MKVLVAYGSKHGGTSGIAEEIGRTLDRVLNEAHAGALVDVRPATDVGEVSEYDAVVLGSGIYGGRWLEPARRLAARTAATLSTVPVWLFSSGPVGDPPKPTGDPLSVEEISQWVRAREHRVFPGRLDRHRLGLAEHALAVAMRVPDGDFRDWPAIRAWAVSIARELLAGPTPVPAADRSTA